ncbi:MAG TPA: hypothetical protein VJR27_01385 [Candidatus Saccharimonadales bacterium]|nr:hypothetical protein [Candidatus Saccharimonadales bacterium]
MTPLAYEAYQGEMAAAQAIHMNGETDLLEAQARREQVLRDIAERQGETSLQIPAPGTLEPPQSQV